MLDDVRDLILNMTDVEEVKKAITTKLDTGIDPNTIIDTLHQTLEEVGTKYERGEFFLSELIMTGYLAKEISNLLAPHMQKAGRKTLGKVIMGTVKNDVHDIGKNIVIMTLQAVGFEVIDLGVDVPNEKFVEVVKELKPDILGLSALLSSTKYELRGVIDALEKDGVRDTVKVIVGGRPLTEEFAKEMGADGYAETSVDAINLVKKLMEIKET